MRRVSSQLSFISFYHNYLVGPNNQRATPGPGEGTNLLGHAAFATSQKPPKYFIDPSPIIIGGIHGPDRLMTTPFNSCHSTGFTAWHYSQSVQDLDFPLGNTPTPSIEGTVYVHWNINDGGYQIWVWREGSSGCKV